MFFIVGATQAQYKKIRSGVWEGTASYYHNKFNGRLTSNGEIFSNNKMTAASNFLKLGTKVRVTNLKNGKSVIVRINDRMNKSNGRLIDMSRISAQRLGFIKAGLAKVRIEVVQGSKAVVARYGKNDYIHSPKKRKAILNGETVAVAKKNTAKRSVLLSTKPTVVAKKQSRDKSILLKSAPVAMVKTTPANTKRTALLSPDVLLSKNKVVKKEVVVARAKPKYVRKKVVSKKKPKKVAMQKKQVQKKELVQPQELSAPKRKSSRYWIEKQKSMKEYLPKSWLETVSNYESDFKEEAQYRKGAINSFMDSTQHFTLTLSDLVPDSSYRFILLSRNLNQLDTFNIMPMTLPADLIKGKEDKKENVTFSRDADSYIYFFDYKVPAGTDYIQMQWVGKKYEGASHEDFWLFVFDQ